MEYELYKIAYTFCLDVQKLIAPFKYTQKCIICLRQQGNIVHFYCSFEIKLSERKS